MRVVIAEDEALLRQGLTRLLQDAGVDVASAVAEPVALLRAVASYDPDVAIVDIRMPPSHTDEGLHAAGEIRRTHPRTGVLVLSHHLESAYAARLLQEAPERAGYLLKDRVADVAILLDALRRITEGECVLDPTIVSRLVARLLQAGPLEELTVREREGLSLMAEGLSNAAVSARLFVTERAVEKHVTSIFGKLGLSSTHDDHRRVLAVLTFLNAR